jgi:hypothetical protein
VIFIKRKAGESVVLNTPNGEITIQMLGRNELGIEMPRGVTVTSANEPERRDWLPSRPGSGRLTGSRRHN